MHDQNNRVLRVRFAIAIGCAARTEQIGDRRFTAETYTFRKVIRAKRFIFWNYLFLYFVISITVSEYFS